MSRCSSAAEGAVTDLIQTGMHGQMRVGDTFGIWTYNDALYAGRFPMQQWAPDLNLTMVQKVSEFLRGQRFEKESVWEKVAAPLSGIIRSSRALTITLVTEGRLPLRGTPFDDEINQLYAQHFSELQNPKLPFVTILVVRAGKIVEYSVNSTINVRIPNPAIPPLRTATPTNAVSDRTEIRPAPPTEIATNAPVTPTAPKAAPLASTPTNVIVAATNAPRVAPIETIKTEPAPPLAAPVTNAIAQTNSPEKKVTPPVTETVAPSPAVNPATNNASSVSNAKTNLAQAETGNIAAVAVAESNRPPPGEETKPVARPLAQTATTVLPSPPSNSGKIIALVVVLVLAGGTLVFLTARGKGRTAPSLISRSIEHEDGPPGKK